MTHRTDTPIRVVLVHDQLLVRQGIKMLLDKAEDIEVAAEATRCAEAVAAARRVSAHVVVVDLDIEGGGGLDAIRALDAIDEPPRILVLTGARAGDRHGEAVRLGAAGIVTKDQAAEVLVRAIRRLREGQAWIGPTNSAEVLHGIRRPAAGDSRHATETEADRIAQLTHRERELAAQVALGHGTRRIAHELGISEKTVRNHLASIYQKLGVSERLELALYAARHGLGESAGGSRRGDASPARSDGKYSRVSPK